MTMKRSRDSEPKQVEAVDLAKWLNLLSEIGKSDNILPTGRVFECKTCNRQFTSFQALGGHSSHKRPKLMTGDLLKSVSVKPKTHECSICGVEFALGQALGGHMRRHRAEMEANSSTTISGDTVVKSMPVLKKSNSSCKRVWGLDLNLMPYNNYLKLGW